MSSLFGYLFRKFWRGILGGVRWGFGEVFGGKMKECKRENEENYTENYLVVSTLQTTERPECKLGWWAWEAGGETGAQTSLCERVRVHARARPRARARARASYI